jgi:LacI family transcriptional regulator
VLLKKFDIELEGPYLAMMLGVEHQLSSLGASTVFLRVGSEDDHDKVRRVMRAGAVDGFFLVGEVNEEALQLVQFPHRPCVVLGGNRCRQPVHSVDINFTMASRLAVEHLASLGHRRIGYLGGGTDFPYQNDQLEGFVTAVRELGLDSDPDLIRLRRSDEGPPVMERVRSLLALRPLPTAIITSDPTYSVIALDLLKQYELSVPSEISLLGFQLDNKTGSVPGITRIEFPFRAVGRAGGSLLRDIVSQPDTPPRQIQISPRLVEGWSCGRLPQSRQAR